MTTSNFNGLTNQAIQEKIQYLEQQFRDSETIHSSDEIVQVLELVELYRFKKKSTHVIETLEYLNAAMATIEDETILRMYLISVIYTMPYIREWSNFSIVINKAATIALEKGWVEILSHVFLLQSYINSKQGQYDIALQEAKLAYYYAQLQNDNNDFARCNAQLIVAFVLLLKGDADGAMDYIQSVKWVEDVCDSREEVIFLRCIRLMISLLQENKVAEEYKALHSILHSSDNFYSCLLMEQIDTMVKINQSKLCEDDYKSIMN
jgi:hypothetical protein